MPNFAGKGSLLRRWLLRRRIRRAVRASPSAPIGDEGSAGWREAPLEVHQAILGPRLLATCAYFPAGRETLADAEEAMLELHCERAGLADGQRVLDLGCGWGALALRLADQNPSMEISAVTPSREQGRFVEEIARRRGLGNLTPLVVGFEALEFPERRFDRVIAIESIAEGPDGRGLLRRVADWLRPEGLVLVQTFCHRNEAALEADGLCPLRTWLMNGEHYRRTAEHWLDNAERAGGGRTAAFHRPYLIGRSERAAHDRGCEWGIRQQLFRRS